MDTMTTTYYWCHLVNVDNITATCRLVQVPFMIAVFGYAHKKNKIKYLSIGE